MLYERILMPPQPVHVPEVPDVPVCQNKKSVTSCDDKAFLPFAGVAASGAAVVAVAGGFPLAYAMRRSRPSAHFHFCDYLSFVGDNCVCAHRAPNVEIRIHVDCQELGTGVSASAMTTYRFGAHS